MTIESYPGVLHCPVCHTDLSVEYVPDSNEVRYRHGGEAAIVFSLEEATFDMMHQDGQRLIEWCVRHHDYEGTLPRKS